MKSFSVRKRCDTHLLSIFVQEYGAEEGMLRDFVRRAMSYALLHEFDVLADALEQRSALRDAPTLDVLAQELWAIE